MKNLLILLFAVCFVPAYAQWTKKPVESNLSSSIAQSKERGLFKQVCDVKQSLHLISKGYVIRRGKLKKKWRFSKVDTNYFAIRECWREEAIGKDGKPESYFLFTLNEDRSLLGVNNYNVEWTALVLDDDFFSSERSRGERFVIDERYGANVSTVYKYTPPRKRPSKKMVAALAPAVDGHMGDMVVYHLDFKPKR